MPGASHRNPRACRRAWPPPSWRCRASIAWRRWARWPPRRRMNWARRSGTIAVVARELERALPENSAEVEDVRLLREQAERCRAIIARLANPEEAMLGATARLPLGAFLDDIAEPYRGEDLEISITAHARSAGRCRRRRSGARPNCCTGWATSSRMPPISPTARSRSRRAGTQVSLRIVGRGRRPGLCAGNLRAHRRALHHLAPRPPCPGRNRDRPAAARWTKHEGMGLGFFIAKILLEQTGGAVSASIRRPAARA